MVVCCNTLDKQRFRNSVSNLPLQAFFTTETLLKHARRSILQLALTVAMYAQAIIETVEQERVVRRIM